MNIKKRLAMKNGILVLTVAVIILSVANLVLNKDDIYAHSNGVPSFECDECHSGAEDKNIEILLKGVPESYISNKTYSLSLEINSDVISEGEYAGGFALSVSGGKLIVEDRKNTQISENYLTHTIDGSKLREWKFKWVAPAQKGVGEVEFTIMAVAANGDYSPNGDVVGVETFKVKPKK